MRNQWRLLLLRGGRTFLPQPSSNPLISPTHHLQVFSSLSPLCRFSSAALSNHSSVIDLFSNPISTDEIKQHLDSNNVVVSHDLVLEVLKNVKSDPDVAVRFFNWVLERDSERLSSNCYNLMAGILGSNGFVKEFWDLVESMRKKGYGVKKGAYNCVAARFEGEGMETDLKRLKGLYDYRKSEDSVAVVSGKIAQIVKASVWGDDVENKIRELGVAFSSGLVGMVVETLATEPIKAYIFFRWVEESGLVKHGEESYNAMAIVLGREDCIDRFWSVVGEMRDGGYEIRRETFVKVLDRFSKRRIMKDCVDLYETAMKNSSSENRPSVQDCAFILRKIAAAGEMLDMDLFTRVLTIVAESGNELPDSTVDAVLKSLAGVDRMEQSRLILDAMRTSGHQPSSRVQGYVGFRLSRSGRSQEATEYVQDLEANGCDIDHHTWISLFKGHCLAGDLSKASDCFKKSVELDSGSSAADVGYNMEMLVDAYCRKGEAVEASGILTSLIKEKGLKPKHTTYKLLISQLLARKGGLEDAVELIDLMKAHGFPPYLDPFVEYVTSRRGSPEDALAFLKAVTVNRFPATSLFVRIFEAYFKAGRTRKAQSFLAICPQYIRNNADVLDLFYNNEGTKRSAKSSEAEVKVEVVSAS